MLYEIENPFTNPYPGYDARIDITAEINRLKLVMKLLDKHKLGGWMDSVDHEKSLSYHTEADLSTTPDLQTCVDDCVAGETYKLYARLSAAQSLLRDMQGNMPCARSRASSTVLRLAFVGGFSIYPVHLTALPPAITSGRSWYEIRYNHSEPGRRILPVLLPPKLSDDEQMQAAS